MEETELGGEPAAAYEQVAGGTAGRRSPAQLYAIHEGTAYAVTYSGLDSRQFDEQLPDVEAMLDSWTWDS